MSFGIGTKVKVITTLYLGRWISPFEIGIIEGRKCSPAGQEVYEVRLIDGLYTFASGEIEEEAEPNL